MRIRAAIVGGGLGGVAAALALNRLGVPYYWIYDEDWPGGQLTSQLVPPDEHRWIEHTGCNRSYSELRSTCRRLFAQKYSLKQEWRDSKPLNPGGGWVSHLAAPPRIWNEAITELLSADSCGVHIIGKVDSATFSEDRIRSVEVRTADGVQTIAADFFLDASETGLLWFLSGVPYRVGIDPKSLFDEPHAPDQGDPDGLQPITMCAALAFDQPSKSKPLSQVDQSRFSLPIKNPISGDVLDLPFYEGASPRSGDWTWFGYRQVLDPTILEDEVPPLTLLNQQHTDSTALPYLEGDLRAEASIKVATELTSDFVAWVQEHCPRHDKGKGYPEVVLSPEEAGTVTGFAQRPYVREGRRVIGLSTLSEHNVSASLQPDPGAPAEVLSVGVGSYRIDIHQRCGGHPTIDIDSIPFEIPLGCLIPEGAVNAFAAGKSLSVSHIANGATRTHPTEWGIGEAAAITMAFCLDRGINSHELFRSQSQQESLCAVLESHGVQRHWPRLSSL